MVELQKDRLGFLQGLGQDSIKSCTLRSIFKTIANSLNHFRRLAETSTYIQTANSDEWEKLTL